MFSPKASGYSAFASLAAIIFVTLDNVDGQARVCYFGPSPGPGPNILDSQHWMKQILPEIRQQCPRRAFLSCLTQEQSDATTVLTNECSESEPLGLEDGSIPDEQFRASSQSLSHSASNARLNQNSFWQPSSDGESWIEVDLVENSVVSGVITQGSPTGNNYRVTQYRVKYQTLPTLPTQPSVYDYVKDGDGNTQVFNGNTDNATTPVTNFFYASINATVVRLEPREWARGIALRFELIHCGPN